MGLAIVISDCAHAHAAFARPGYDRRELRHREAEDLVVPCRILTPNQVSNQVSDSSERGLPLLSSLATEEAAEEAALRRRIGLHLPVRGRDPDARRAGADRRNVWPIAEARHAMCWRTRLFAGDAINRRSELLERWRDTSG